MKFCASCDLAERPYVRIRSATDGSCGRRCMVCVSVDVDVDVVVVDVDVDDDDDVKATNSNGLCVIVLLLLIKQHHTSTHQQHSRVWLTTD
jgi:hypothetical protein